MRRSFTEEEESIMFHGENTSDMEDSENLEFNLSDFSSLENSEFGNETPFSQNSNPGEILLNENTEDLENLDVFSEGIFAGLSSNENISEDEESIEIKINPAIEDNNAQSNEVHEINTDFDYASGAYNSQADNYLQEHNEELSDESIIIEAVRPQEVQFLGPRTIITIEVRDSQMIFENTEAFLEYLHEYRNQYQRFSKEFYKEKLKELKKIKYGSFIKKAKEKQEDCSICLEKFKKTRMIYLLPCDHYYHIKCISSWISQNDTCPSCRVPIIQNSAFNFQ